MCVSLFIFLPFYISIWDYIPSAGKFQFSVSCIGTAGNNFFLFVQKYFSLNFKEYFLITVVSLLWGGCDLVAEEEEEVAWNIQDGGKVGGSCTHLLTGPN